MNPVAFRIVGLEIRWYGILMATGMAVAVWLIHRFARQKGIASDTVYDFLLWVIPTAVVGSRIWYVLFNLDYYRGDLLSMINLREGGLAIHGGVIFGTLAGWIFCKIKKLSFWDMADMVAPGLILAQAIGRWGNFINQEAHGGPTDLPWGIMIDGVKVHPTFLYESLWNLLVFAVLMKIYKKKPFEGSVFLLYGILYSIGRFFIEGLRTDSLMVGGLRTAQLVSIAVVVIFGGIFVYRMRNLKKESQE